MFIRREVVSLALAAGFTLVSAALGYFFNFMLIYVQERCTTAGWGGGVSKN